MAKAKKTEGADEIRASLPKNFWNTIEGRVRQIVRNVPDVYAALSDDERAKQDKQVEGFMQQLEGDLKGQVDRIARDYLAEGHPRMLASTAEISIKKGIVKLALSSSQDFVPDELYNHSGKYLVVLIEDQLDWVTQLTRVDEAGAAAEQADLALGSAADDGSRVGDADNEAEHDDDQAAAA